MLCRRRGRWTRRFAPGPRPVRMGAHHRLAARRVVGARRPRGAQPRAPFTLAFDGTPTAPTRRSRSPAGRSRRSSTTGRRRLPERLAELVDRYNVEQVNDLPEQARPRSPMTGRPSRCDLGMAQVAATAWLVDAIRGRTLELRPPPVSLRGRAAPPTSAMGGWYGCAARMTMTYPRSAVTLAAWASATAPSGAIC